MRDCWPPIGSAWSGASAIRGFACFMPSIIRRRIAKFLHRLFDRKTAGPMGGAFILGSLLDESLVDTRAAQLSTPTLELRDIRRGWVRIFFDRRQIRVHRFKRGSGHPTEQPTDDQVLMRVHFDIVYLRIAGHRGAGRENAGLALRSEAGRMNVG